MPKRTILIVLLAWAVTSAGFVSPRRLVDSGPVADCREFMVMTVRLALILLLAGLATACVHVHIDEAGLEKLERFAEESEAAARARQYIVVRGTPLEETDEGHRQILLESSLVRVPGEAPIQALATAESYPSEGPGRVWLGGQQAPDASFGLRAHVLEMPSIVTRDGEEANAHIGMQAPHGPSGDSHELSLAPVLDGEVLQITVGFVGREAQAIVRAVPETVVRGPAGRVWIFEVVPAPVGVPGR
ncbi:MAG: hypothetical protein P1V36_18065 [Planctomycetota bacterium]|nr:hypothetical protein [Planctomycetota bacterium]